MKHARFSPSAAARWMSCAASIPLTADAPSSGSYYADEGTAAHALADRGLTYGKNAAFWIGEQIQVGQRIFTVDQEMANRVQLYLDVVRESATGLLLPEQRVDFSAVIGIPEQSGTSDAITFDAAFKRLSVWDLKYGQERVEAEENVQLMTYAAAVLSQYEAVYDELESVELGIVQPKLDSISTWTTTVQRIREHGAALRAAAERVAQAQSYVDRGEPLPAELYGPSEKACRWCPISATCEAQRAYMSALVYQDFELLTDESKELVSSAEPPPAKPDMLGRLYGRIPHIRNWLKALEGEITRQVLAGMIVIGPDNQPMKPVEGKKGPRKWNDAKEAEGVLVGLLSEDKAYAPREIVSPAQAEKAMGKQQFAIAMSDMCRQAPGKVHIALGSDPRPRYEGAAKAEEFDEVAE